MQLTPVLRPPQADLDDSALPHSTKVDLLNRCSHFLLDSFLLIPMNTAASAWLIQVHLGNVSVNVSMTYY
jgi:hypothetical protein